MTVKLELGGRSSRLHADRTEMIEAAKQWECFWHKQKLQCSGILDAGVESSGSICLTIESY